MSETGVKSDPAFCLGPSIKETNSVTYLVHPQFRQSGDNRSDKRRGRKVCYLVDKESGGLHRRGVGLIGGGAGSHRSRASRR